MAGIPPPVPAEAVLDHIGEAADIIVPLAAGEPATVLDAIEAGADGLRGVRVHQMHALRDRPYLHGAFGDRLTHVSYFLSDVTRQPFWNGTVDLVPNNFSEVPAILRHATKCSLVVASASPPDRHGYFTLGTNADYTAPLIGQVPFFLEVNQRMPRTQGRHVIHASTVLGWCEADYPLTEVVPRDPTAADDEIGRLVAERVVNGATLQVGIGSIPSAVLNHLGDHKDLGVHTELLSDGIAKLIDDGVINGTCKTIHPHKAVTTFCLGTTWLYDWLQDNSAVELLPVDWVNDPRLVAREPNFVSINATTEVDLLGQCASETVGGRYWSSSGGQSDFARGAMYSPGGKAFVVLPSLARNGVSRIRATLTEGSVVTTMKNTVDHVVTEWGVAELKGASLAQRARRLIAIAHPSVRDQLEHDAKAHDLLP